MSSSETHIRQKRREFNYILEVLANNSRNYMDYVRQRKLLKSSPNLSCIWVAIRHFLVSSPDYFREIQLSIKEDFFDTE